MEKTFKILQGSPKVRIVILLILVFFAGFIIRGRDGTEPAKQEGQNQQKVSQKWTCSMHPQIIADKPGKCPKCGMDLIPLALDSVVGSGAGELRISDEAARLMEIETSIVERKYVTAEIRMVGKVDYDETRVKNITAWVPGRIDRLYVDFTGISVKKGDHLVDLYSPQLISSQAELLQASKAAGNIKSDTSELIKRSAMATLDAAREKLRLLGLNSKQIKKIENSQKAAPHITIYSPMGGVVIHKHAKEGMYVNTGMPVYTVADLSSLWVKLDAYESDLPWIRYGQEVEFTTEAHPGEVFPGIISFIAPVLDAKTRTVKLRINVDNTDGKLKPDMFVRATVRPQIAAGGRVMATAMAGKWICPMHPAQVRETEGGCDICGMDLVTTESLGYVKADDGMDVPIVIPVTAPLITGKRAIVYVKKPNTDVPTYESRQIVLGPRAGDYYIVKSGLQEGEIVVTNGNFKIDSEMQIQAKPSMMNQQGKTKSEKIEKELVAVRGGEQTTCPVMGGTINKNIFTEYKGKKVYFCCAGCIEKFEENPEEYISKLPQFKE